MLLGFPWLPLPYSMDTGYLFEEWGDKGMINK